MSRRRFAPWSPRMQSTRSILREARDGFIRERWSAHKEDTRRFFLERTPNQCNWCARRSLYQSGWDRDRQQVFTACREHRHLLPAYK